MSVPQMPQCETLMSMSIGVNGFGVNVDQDMLPWAADASWPSQPVNLVGEVIVVVVVVVSGG
jgi:hypothetical protein